MVTFSVCQAFVPTLLKRCDILSWKSLQNSLFRYFHTSCILQDSRNKWKLTQMGVDLEKYTLEPIPLPRTGGRGPDGRIWTRRIGGGDRKYFRMVDYKREESVEGEPTVERVQEILKDDLHSGYLAIIAGSNRKRYIIATENMKPGDLIHTSDKVTRMAVRASEGDAHPVGSLPIGSIVSNVEVIPGAGGVKARAAGTSCQLLRKVGDRCILRMPSKREIDISQQCMATVGRVSNIEHNKQHIGSAGNARRMGIRPKSGWWHRKTGYNGRKIRPLKPVKVYTEPTPPQRHYADFHF